MLIFLIACTTDDLGPKPTETAETAETGAETADPDHTGSPETGSPESGGETGAPETGSPESGGETGSPETAEESAEPEVSGGAFDVEDDATTTWIGVSQRLGYTLATDGDIDGDGVEDLVMQSLYSAGAGGHGGGTTAALTVVYGGTVSPGDYDTTGIPELWAERTSADVDLRADLDGDGVHEVLWMGTDDVGRTGIEILWGDGSRWTDGDALSGDTTLKASSGGFLGSTLSVGDADGDGLSDVLASRASGAVLVYGDGDRLEDGELSDEATFLGALGYFGGGAVALGDLDGDGQDDVAVADVYADLRGADMPGAVYIGLSDGRWEGELGLPDDADIAISGPARAGLVYLGYRMSAGDLDGDGYAELIAGASSYDGGAGIAWIFDGRADWEAELSTDEASASVYGDGARPMAVAVETTDDIDGDGARELLVGATDNGAYVYWGGELAGALTDADAALTFTGGPDSAGVGLNVGSADLDDDGREDLLVSGYAAWSYDGTVWMLAGSAL